MWKFKVSKYKNAVPKFPKKENWINDLPINNGFQSCGNHITAGYAFMAFNVDSPGSLGILPVDTKGCRSANPSILHCHGDFVNDFAFSPHDGNLLCTGSRDNSVRLWQIPDGWSGMDVIQPSVLAQEESNIDSIGWHPLASSVIGATSGKVIKLYDVEKQTAFYDSMSHDNVIQSFSWRGDGKELITSGKDKKIRIIDPRSAGKSQETDGHDGIRDSRVLWLGNSPFVISTGFGCMRNREIKFWDTRAFKSPANTIDLDTSTGTLMPLFDQDTNMLFIVGKGDTCLRFFETTDKQPFITMASVDNSEQIKGACLVPKLKMDLMNAEVNRILIMTKQAILPTPYQVPRKSYNEFYPELFPETYSGEPSMTADQWRNGENTPGKTVSLDPNCTQIPTTSPQVTAGASNAAATAQPMTVRSEPLLTPKEETDTVEKTSEKTIETSNKFAPSPVETSNKFAPSPVASSALKSSTKSDDILDAAPAMPVRKPFAGVHHSKFRHLKATVLHRDHHIENIRNISQSLPGESDFFHVNAERAAIPLSGSGGLISILELSNVGRLPDTGVPALQNGCMVMDFTWDPFDDSRLAVAGDDAKIRLWRIPEGGITETMTQPESVLRGHTEKIYFVRFHPLATDLLASASYDLSVKIWDLTTGEACIELNGHTSAIFCLSWSPDGKKIATLCKDGKLRIYDPRRSPDPISEGLGPAGSRGARLEWACGGRFLVSSGFDKSSQRTVAVFDPMSLNGPLAQHEIDGSPAILVTHYDEDTSTLFMTGRGDTMVHTFEIHDDPPYIYALSPYHAAGLHQALSFLPKKYCDVRNVEFAKAYRLTNSHLEPVSFTLPRVKTEYFQDDVYPETRIVWEPVMTGREWLDGLNRIQSTMSLRPADMKPLSEVPIEAPKPKKYESQVELTQKTPQQKKDELITAMMVKLGDRDENLTTPDDDAEGVDEDEWSD